MLRYYSYYSVGGYKDMYLGNSEMKEEEVFFLPLLPVWRKRAEKNNDKELADKVETLEQLPSIKILRENNSYDFPEDANVVISHGAFKILLKSCNDGKNVLCFRDIENDEKDENGRSIPYLIAITGDTDEDKAALHILCTYMAMNVKTTGGVFSELFSYDAEKNGVSFKLARLNKWVDSTLLAVEEAAIETVDNKYMPAEKDALLVLPNGITREKALSEQELKDSSTYTISIDDIIPQDDSAKLSALLRRFVERTQNNKSKQLKMMGGAALTGFVLGFLAGFFYKK